jgi:hypothetical protein
MPALQVGVPVSQTLQKLMSCPQLSLALPATQLVPSQQPPLQSVVVKLPQAIVQVPLPVSQAIPVGQSLAKLHGPWVRSGMDRSCATP